jgi:CheY-like chemotaxis protein
MRVPIIAITAHTMRGDRDLCLQAGCDAFVPKPVDRNVLLGILDRYLRRSSVASMDNVSE